MDRLAGRADASLPARRLRYVGQGDFTAIGRQTVDQLVAIGGLTPGASVLDVGCGIGRLAIPLTRYLDSGARYVGFDIVPVASPGASRTSPRSTRTSSSGS